MLWSSSLPGGDGRFRWRNQNQPSRKQNPNLFLIKSLFFLPGLLSFKGAASANELGFEELHQQPNIFILESLPYRSSQRCNIFWRRSTRSRIQDWKYSSRFGRPFKSNTAHFFSLDRWLARNVCVLLTLMANFPTPRSAVLWLNGENLLRYSFA